MMPPRLATNVLGLTTKLGGYVACPTKQVVHGLHFEHPRPEEQQLTLTVGASFGGGVTANDGVGVKGRETASGEATGDVVGGVPKGVFPPSGAMVGVSARAV